MAQIKGLIKEGGFGVMSSRGLGSTGNLDDDYELLVTAHTVLDSQRPQMDGTADRGLSSGVGREGAKEMGALR